LSGSSFVRQSGERLLTEFEATGLPLTSPDPQRRVQFRATLVMPL
jgi:hypothetical protein